MGAPLVSPLNSPVPLVAPASAAFLKRFEAGMVPLLANRFVLLLSVLKSVKLGVCWADDCGNSDPNSVGCTVSPLFLKIELKSELLKI